MSDEAPPSDGEPPKPKSKQRPMRFDPERIRYVDQLLRACLSHGSIANILAKEWDISPRQVRRYISATLRQYAKDGEAMKGHRTDFRRAQLEGVLERCLTTVDPDHIDPKTGDYMVKPDLRTAVIALHRLCLIDGVYTPQQVNVTGRVQVASMRSSDRETELIEMLKKYRAAKLEREATKTTKAH